MSGSIIAGIAAADKTGEQQKPLRFRRGGGAAGRFSAFAVNGPAEGVTLTGLSYEAAKITLSPTFPLGVSNEFVGKEAVITVTSGTLLLIWDGSPEDRIG